MKVDLEVPITAPPIHLFKIGEAGREDITNRSYKGFSDAQQTKISFRVYDGNYVVVDFLKHEREISVVNGQVIETELEGRKAQEAPVQSREAPVPAPEQAPMSFKKKARKNMEEL